MRIKRIWRRFFPVLFVVLLLIGCPGACPRAASIAESGNESAPAEISSSSALKNKPPETADTKSEESPDTSGTEPGENSKSKRKINLPSSGGKQEESSQSSGEKQDKGSQSSGGKQDKNSQSSGEKQQETSGASSEDAPAEIQKTEVTGCEQYIRDNADSNYAGSEEPVPVDFLTTAILTVSASSSVKSTRQLWKDEDGDGYSDHWEALSGMDYGEAVLYDMGGDYLVARIGTLGNDAAEVLDFHAGRNDTTGTEYSDILYRSDTGLVYVPRKYRPEKDGKPTLNSVKTELLYSVPDGKQETSVSIEINGPGQSGTADFDLLDDTVSVELPAGKKKITGIEVDGVPYAEAEQISEYKDGILTVNVSPMTTSHIEINMRKTSFLERAFSRLFSKEVHAASVTPGTLNGHLVFDGIPSVGDSWITKGTNTYVEGGHKTSDGYINPVFLKTGTDEEFEALINYIAKNSGSIDTSQGYAIYKYSSAQTCGMTGVERCALSKKGYVTNQSTKNKVSPIYISQDIRTNLFCAHMSINNQGSVTSDDCGQWWKILKVDENNDNRWGTVTVGIVNPTEQTQAGVGIFKMTWMISARIRIQKIASEDSRPLSDASYEVWTAETGGTKVATLTTGKDGYSSFSVIENASFFSASRSGTDDAQHSFYLREASAPPGYLKNSGSSCIELRIGEKRTITYSQNGNGQKTSVLMDTPEEGTPEISTMASIDGKKEISSRTGNVTITDTISYKGLVPGRSYTISGTVMNQGTGKETGASSEKKFTPESSDGEISIDFSIDADAGDYVVFEKLFRNGKEIASHEDLSDAGQTVTLRGTVPTGIRFPYEPVKYLLLAAGAVCFILALRRPRRSLRSH